MRAIIIILVFAALPLIYLALYVPRRLKFRLTPQTLVVRGDVLYGRTILREELDADHAEIISSMETGPYRLTLRLNGVGLPNYRSGWFSTADKGKALVFARPECSAVAIPTQNNYTLILCPQDPQQFLATLRTPGSQGDYHLAR
ncbi:MAG TPA: PH domain-containing protein [Acidobacteriaceae bacterium]|nr:PH domain-containing protein [Acidobacteriaceae bacterium]